MDADARSTEVFFNIHRDLPREAPGSKECTLRALELTGLEGGDLRVLDIGCGPGAQTLDLAEALPGAEIVAVDTHQPFLDDLAGRARERGLGDRIRPMQADMAALPGELGTFDLLWCEGAAYIMGVPQALEAWRPLLRPGGHLAFSEAVWLTDRPGALARGFWEEYPDMRDLPATRDLVGPAGYRLLGDFVLPREAWEAYYGPQEERLEKLTPEYRDDPVATAVLDEARHEIEVFRCSPGEYGYAFLVLERPRD